MTTSGMTSTLCTGSGRIVVITYTRGRGYYPTHKAVCPECGSYQQVSYTGTIGYQKSGTIFEHTVSHAEVPCMAPCDAPAAFTVTFKDVIDWDRTAEMDLCKKHAKAAKKDDYYVSQRPI